MFQAVPCSSSGGKIALLQHLVASLCERLYSTSVESGLILLSTGVLYSSLQRVTIPDAAIMQFDLLKMSMVLLETCRGL